MRMSRHTTIKRRLTWLSALASAGALFLAGCGFFGFHLSTFRTILVRNLVAHAEMIGLNSVAALQFDDRETARQILAALRVDSNVIAGAIYAVDESLFAVYTRDGTAASSRAPQVPQNDDDGVLIDAGRLTLSREIVSDGERLGSVHLAYSLDALYADVRRYVAIAGVTLILSLVLALWASSRLQRSLVDPITRLADAARRISRERDYSIRVDPPRQVNELSTLVDTFNGMLAQIELQNAEVEAGKAQVQDLNDQLERRVQQRTAELETTNRELEAFTYSVSHDLRAPLRRIDGFGKLLVEEYASQLPDEGARYLRRMRDGAREMGLLVDDLLNLARLGRQEVKWQVTGLRSVVEKVIGAVSHEAEGRNVEWKLQPLPFVECDPVLIEVVFTNLLTNALKYTRPRERTIIEVGTVERHGVATVFVRDNGVGFSMKYADKLFGVFQRLHRAEDFEGTGVGLATVQRIVHKHGGEIWAEAELDRGACFYFTVGGVRERGVPVPGVQVHGERAS